MITANVKRFIQLQDLVNDQIGQYGQAEIELVGELETLGDQLTGDEVSVLCSYINEDRMDDMEYEDIEWMIE
jgi:hypothetical protein